jgi:hypothetical protein
MEETKRESLNWKRKKEKELSSQVNSGEISLEDGDAMAHIAGLAHDEKADRKK